MRSQRVFFALLLFNVSTVLILYNITISSTSKKLSTVHQKPFAVEFMPKYSTESTDDVILLRFPSIKENSEQYLPPLFSQNSLRPNVTFLLQPLPRVTLTCSGHCVHYQALRWTMTIFVKSAAGNFEKRATVRESWGANKQVYHAAITTIFVIGKSENNSYNDRVRYEHKKYGDILQYDGPDDYSNIAVKTLAGMQWAIENLRGDSLYSSADDDFLIRTHGLAESVDENLISKSKYGWPEFPFICGFKKGEGEEPVREGDPEFSKWAVSTDAYKWPAFPVYCHGGLYTSSVRVIHQIFVLSRQEPTLRLDDVWLTGILRWKMGMPDAMVIAPKHKTGYHLETYKKDFGNYAVNSVREIMESIFRAFEADSLCRCYR